MAGSIGLSLQQQFDLNGKLLIGGKLYFYEAGTTTPQNAYQDSALAVVWPNPITLGSSGRVPQLYFADGSIRCRLTNSAGVVQFDDDNILVVGASGGGGSGSSSVDPTKLFTTGDVKSVYGTGAITGWVRCNGRTIGSATSGGSERANADTQALFEWLWTNGAFLSVSTGRGASAAADWAANKTIGLPDFRGYVLGGLDDMGNTAAGRLTSTYFGSAATSLGVSNGSESNTLDINKIPAHNHTASASVTDPGHSHGQLGSDNTAGLLRPVVDGANQTRSDQNTESSTTGISVSVTVNNAGSGNAHANVQPTSLVTFYIKL